MQFLSMFNDKKLLFQLSNNAFKTFSNNYYRNNQFEHLFQHI